MKNPSESKNEGKKSDMILKVAKERSYSKIEIAGGNVAVV